MIEIKSNLIKDEFKKHFRAFINRKLMKYTKERNLRLVQEYLEEGADPNYQDEKGVTPLMHAVSFVDPAIMNALLRAGANPDIQDEAGFSSMHHAVFVGGEKIKALFLYGGSLDIKDKNGDCPLSLSSNWQYKETTNLILELKNRDAKLTA